MANNCFYQMMIRGTKQSCDEWLHRMRSYDADKHFFRIFEAEVYDEGGDGSDYYMCITGDCAWSLESCCRSGYTNGFDLFAVNTQELSLVMEAFSSEIGMDFQEHYVYKNGLCLKAECVDYEEYLWDKSEYPSFEDFKKEYDLPQSLTEDDLEDGELYKVGGFQDWSFSI